MHKMLEGRARGCAVTSRAWRSTGALFVVVLGRLLCAPGTRAATSSAPLPALATDGRVNATTWSQGTLYVGGHFTSVGPAAGGLASVSGSSGQVVRAWTVAGTVSAMASDGSGGWYIGGSFTSVDGTAIHNAAHVLSD